MAACGILIQLGPDKASKVQLLGIALSFAVNLYRFQTMCLALHRDPLQSSHLDVPLSRKG